MGAMGRQDDCLKGIHNCPEGSLSSSGALCDLPIEVFVEFSQANVQRFRQLQSHLIRLPLPHVIHLKNIVHLLVVFLGILNVTPWCIHVHLEQMTQDNPQDILRKDWLVAEEPEDVVQIPSQDVRGSLKRGDHWDQLNELRNNFMDITQSLHHVIIWRSSRPARSSILFRNPHRQQLVHPNTRILVVHHHQLQDELLKLLPDFLIPLRPLQRKERLDESCKLWPQQRNASPGLLHSVQEGII
uniref:Uncharacterized protein n=1 Tax=Lutzomyia longipalpis TaxID=7200 RepID=A0A1B0CNP3_LUTLO